MKTLLAFSPVSLRGALMTQWRRKVAKEIYSKKRSVRSVSQGPEQATERKEEKLCGFASRSCPQSVSLVGGLVFTTYYRLDLKCGDL